MKEQIPNIINTLIQSNEEEINELKKQIKIEKMDAEKFNILYMFQIEQILGSIFSDNDKIQFIYIHYDFLERHIENLIYEKTNIRSCITDKSRFIIKCYEQYLNDKNFYCDFNKEGISIPKFGLFEDWIEYCDSLFDLYYGKMANYLTSLIKLKESNIRTYKHICYECYIIINDETLKINSSLDEKLDLLKEDDKYLIPKILLKNKEYEKYDKYDNFYYKVPQEDITKIYYVEKEVKI